MKSILAIAFFLVLVETQTEVPPEYANGNLEEIMTFLHQINKTIAENSCSSAKPSSCAELFLQGTVKSGIYYIYPKPWFTKNPIRVFCDMDTDGGGWTVFQKRDDYEVTQNFFRDWSDYRTGFGAIERDYWLGNDNLYVLTNQDYVTLRVDLEDFEGHKRHAVYKEFQISSWLDKFRIKIGNYFGDAGDMLKMTNNYTFVTYDNGDVNKCAENYKGGWWYVACHGANLNGLYLRGNHTSYADGVIWASFKGAHYSIKKSEMKIRPTMFKNCQEEI